MRRDGAVTVFLALVFACICSLMCGLLESARMAGAGYYLSETAGSALDSLFSQYHRGIWDSYRLLLLEYESPDGMAAEFESYLAPYLDTPNWYAMRMDSAKAGNIRSVTDSGGEYLEKEILDYMKYGVWDIDMDPDHAAEILKNLKEAGAVRDVAASYGGRTKEAVQLEKALEAVGSCLNAQREYFAAAADSLEQQNAGGFFKAADRMKREMNRMPGLVETYEKRADRLEEQLNRTREEFAVRQQDISPGVSDALRQEALAYEEYTAKDGERRREVRGLLPAAERGKEIVERTEEAVREVEEEIEEWEASHDDEDDGDTLDEDALWNPVKRLFRACAPPALSFASGVKDKKTQGLLEQLEQMADAGMLSLVLPKGAEISEGLLDKSGFPSEESVHSGSASGGLVEKLITDEYCVQFCTDFLSDEKKEVQYELEYLISGKDTDRENLTGTVKKLLAVREGMNFIHILTDSRKRGEARALAASIAGAASFTPLTSILSFFIMGVWALGEAAVDVRAMLEGGKVPFVKTEDTWKLGLEDLLLLAQGKETADTQAEGEGLTYTEYLKLLLFLEESGKKYYRLMDVMQMNIRRTEPGFLMSRCAYSAELTASLVGKHLFFSSGGKAFARDSGCPMEITVQKAY